MKEKLMLHITRLAREQKRWKRWHKAVTVMGAAVVFCTVYALILPAITMGAKTFCGMEEHIHTEECYLLRRIGAATPSDAERREPWEEEATPSNAELEELREFYLTEGGKGTASSAERATASDAQQYEWDENDRHKFDMYLIGDDSFLLDDYLEYTEGMEYDEENYELVRICEMEEHTHSLICYSDPEADLEDESVWSQTIPELSGNIPEDLIRVAESQMNYRESEKNYEVEGVDEIKGYSRYGQWYGEPYGDWGTMFVSFCMNYAGVENAAVVKDPDSLMGSMKGGVPELYRERDYIPKRGDLVFAAGAAGEPGRVGIITEVELDDQGNVSRFTAIEGDYENRVSARTHRGGEEDIRGFAALSKLGPEDEIVIVTLTAETENAMVTAVFEKTTLPENVRMEAAEIPKEDPRALEMREKLAEQGKTEGKVLTAMVPLNITFLDGEGNVAEPAGPVQFSVEFKTPVKNVDEEIGEEAGETAGASGENAAEESISGGTGEDTSESSEENNERENAGSGGSGDGGEVIETGRAEISARETMRVGTAIGEVPDTGSEENGQDTEEPEGPSWQLFSQSQDGKLENHSTDEKTKIEVKEDGAVAQVDFEVGAGQGVQDDSQPDQDGIQDSGAGNVSMYLAAYHQEELTTVHVNTIGELKEALTNDTAQLIILAGDINVESDEDAGYLPIQMDGKTKILNLNGKSITVHRTEKSLIDVRSGSNLTIRDESEDGTSPREEITSVEGMENLLPVSDEEPVDKESVGKGYSYETNSEGQRILKFYVTTSVVADQETGETIESLEEHTVTNPGVIKVTSPEGTGAYSAFYVHDSTLTLESGGIIGCSNRAINLEGASSLNLRGGYLCGNNSPDKGGAIRAVGTSKINLPAEMPEGSEEGAVNIENCAGTYISGNTSLGGGAIYMGERSVLTILKGYITNNRATNGNGGAIYADGETDSVIYLRGGFITNNMASYSGGGIYKTGSSRLIMEAMTENTGTRPRPGGIVARNLAVDGEGGGITITQGQAKFVNGYVSHNRTDTHEHWGGGGVFISDGAYSYVENALVTQNQAGGFGGGVTGCPTSRVFIADTNGMAIYGNAGGDKENIENHLSGASSSKPHDHDHMKGYDVFIENGYNDFFCALTCTVGRGMLGGGSASWSGSYDGNPVSSVGDDKEPLQCTSVMGLNANPSIKDINNAGSAARIFFNGNSSWTHAGGILCNGYMFAGEVEDIHTPDRIAVEGWKTLENKDGANIPLTSDKQFEFEIFNKNFASLGVFGNKLDGTINFQLMLAAPRDGTFVYYIKERDVDNGILSDSTVYKVVLTVGKKEEIMNPQQFPDYPEMMYGKKKYTYTIDDVKLYKRFDGQMTEETGWGDPMTGDIWDKNEAEQGHDTLYLNGRNKESFVNREKGEETAVTVRKKWNVSEEDQIPPSVQVELLRDGERVRDKDQQNPVILNAANGWEYTWKNLPVKDSNSKLYTYTVKEIGADNYHSEITVSQHLWGASWRPADKLEAGKSYIILNAAKDKILRISSAHQDKFFTKNDWMDFNESSASGLDLGSIFTAEHPGGDSEAIVLSTGLTTGRSWLRIENGDIGNLKGTNGVKWSSPFVYEYGQLKGAPGQENQWDGEKAYRVIFGSKKYPRFDAKKPSEEWTSEEQRATVYTLSGEQWVKATGLVSGEKYAIVCGDKVLSIDPESPDDEFRKEDWAFISEGKRSGDNFVKDAFGQNSIFTAEHPDNRDGYDKNNYLILAATLSSSKKVWLLVENKEGSYFKSTIGSEYASSFEVTDGSCLSGKYGFWYNNGVDSYIAILKQYEDITPDAVADGNGADVVVYEKVLGSGEGTEGAGMSGPLFTITNTPVEEKRFNLHIKKVSALNTQEGLKNAHFELKSGDECIKFIQSAAGENGSYVYSTNGDITDLVTGERGELYISSLPKGTYVLHETQAPPGYSVVEDQTIVIDGTEDTNIYLDPIKEPVYVLPETGGNGARWYALGGMLFMMAGGLVYGYSSRRRRERRVNR